MERKAQPTQIIEKGHYRVEIRPISDLWLLDKNARYMKAETFKNLADNVKDDGDLSSIPLCNWADDKLLVLSGNHRVMAAKEAGIEEIIIMVDTRDLTREQRIAIQLSHNALVGEDDPIILKELWAEIEKIDLKYYTGLDDKTLAELNKVVVQNLSEVDLSFRTILFLCLAKEVERLDGIMASIKDRLESKNSPIYTADLADYDRYMDALAKTQASYNIRNTATALMVILDIFERHETDLAEGWQNAEDRKDKSWVPLSSIFGSDKVPIGVAQVLKQAVDDMKEKRDITNKNLWQALEYLAADYLGGIR